MRRFPAAPLILLVSLVFLSPLPAWAWGRDGHRIVCAIAWDDLTPAAREKVSALAHTRGRDEFAEMCIWADDIKSERPDTGPLHYIDLPRRAARVELGRDCRNGRCVVDAITADIDALRGNARPAAREDALRFLVHFVGDIHQPLHVAFGDDQGGNKIKGRYFGRDMTFHAIWDYGLIDALGQSWPMLARRLESEITPAERNEWLAVDSPLQWADESFAIARLPEVGYTKIHDGFDLWGDYEETNVNRALTRLKMAGVRLGALLNKLFG